MTDDAAIAPAGAAGTLVERRWATSEVRRIERPDGAAWYRKRLFAGEGDHINEEVARARIEREALVLELVGTVQWGPRLTCPRLVEADPEQLTIVTEEVPGRPLHDYIVKRFRGVPHRRMLQALYLAGRWIRKFQTLPVPDNADRPSPLDPLDPVEYCDIRLRRIQEEFAYRWMTPSRRTLIRSAVAALWAWVPEEDRRVVWCHADYAPTNILWDGRRLAAIDYSMAHADYWTVDPAHFLHRLEMFAVYFPWRRWPITVWKRAFLRGFGEPELESRPVYQVMAMRHLICRLATYVRRRPETLKEREHNRWVRGMVRRRLVRMSHAVLRQA